MYLGCGMEGSSQRPFGDGVTAPAPWGVAEGARTGARPIGAASRCGGVVGTHLDDDDDNDDDDGIS